MGRSEVDPPRFGGYCVVLSCTIWRPSLAVPLNWSDGDFLAGAEGGVRLLSKLLLQGDS